MPAVLRAAVVGLGGLRVWAEGPENKPLSPM